MWKVTCGSCNETPHVPLPPLVSGTNSSSCVPPTAEEWAELAMSRMPGTDGGQWLLQWKFYSKSRYTGCKEYLSTASITPWVFYILTLTKGVLEPNNKQKTRSNFTLDVRNTNNISVRVSFMEEDYILLCISLSSSPMEHIYLVSSWSEVI